MVAVKEVIKISFCVFYIFSGSKIFKWCLGAECYGSVVIKAEIATWQADTGAECYWNGVIKTEIAPWQADTGAECYGNVVIKAEIAPWQAGTGGSIAPTLSQLGTWRRCVVNSKLLLSYIRERTFTYCTGGWVGRVAGLEDKKYLATRQFVSRTFMLSRSPGEYCDPNWKELNNNNNNNNNNSIIKTAAKITGELS